MGMSEVEKKRVKAISEYHDRTQAMSLSDRHIFYLMGIIRRLDIENAELRHRVNELTRNNLAMQKEIGGMRLERGNEVKGL